MPKLNRYRVFLFLLVVGYGVFEYYRPKPLDWRVTYSNKDKIPFGTQALFRLLPDLLANQKVESLRIPPYNHLKNSKPRTQTSSYLFVNHEFKADLNDQKQLLNYVRNGNTVFISSYYFADSLMTVLGVKAMEHKPGLKDTAQYVNFVNPHLKTPKGEIFPKDDGRNYFKITDPGKATLLASNEKNEPVFVKVGYGKGNFYLHCLPIAFTNYYLMDSLTNRHAFHALSYLPRQPAYWDEYQKQGRFGENESSIFRYIASEPALRMAYYLVLVGLIIYVIFAGKRTQRIIPIINPPKNASLEFVKTIGNMYYRKGDHSNLAEKLIQHFKMYIRERFGVTANQQLTEAELERQLIHKSGLPADKTKNLLEEIFYAEKAGRLSADELKSLNKKMEEFYEKTR
jgi:hypothetical protein